MYRAKKVSSADVKESHRRKGSAIVCRLVEEPPDFADWFDELSRVEIRVFFRTEDFVEGCSFVGTTNEKGHVAGAVQNWGGESDAGCSELRDFVGHDPAIRYFEGRGFREERSGMSIVAESEKDDIYGRMIFT